MMTPTKVYVVVEKKTHLNRGLKSFTSVNDARDFIASLPEVEGVSYAVEEVLATEPREVAKPTKAERERA